MDANTLSNDEINAVVMALMRGRQRKGANEKEITQVLKWAQDIRMGNTVLDLVLSGRVNLDIVEGEIKVKSVDA